MQTVPWILGIAHPTGFPLYTLIGWFFAHVCLPFGSVAWRTNILSGCCAAASAGAIVCIMQLLDSDGFAAFIGSLSFSWSSLIWNRALHADPHTMSALFAILTLLFALRYRHYGTVREVYCAALAAGLGLATHPEVLFVLPAIVIAIIAKGNYSWKLLVRVTAFALLPLLFYAYLPLRSAFVSAHGIDPLGLPPFDGSQASLYNSNHTSTLSGFVHEVSGDQFGAGATFLHVFDVRTYPAAIVYWCEEMLPYADIVEIGLAIAGGIVLLRRDTPSFLILLIGTLGVLPFAFAYQNIEADVDRYFISSTALIVILATLSSTVLQRSRLNVAAYALACVLLAVSAGQQWNANSAALSNRNDPGGQPVIDAVRSTVPDGTIIIASWLDATAIEYGAYVQHSLGSRIVIVGWPGEFQDKYAAWTAAKPVYIFADPNSYANAESLPCGWVKETLPSDGYRHVLRVTPLSRHSKPNKRATKTKSACATEF